MAAKEKIQAGALKVKDKVEVWAHRASPKVFYDRGLVWITLGLMLIGLIMVTSASFPVGTYLTGNPFHFMHRHMMFLAVSLVALLAALFVPIDRWLKSSVWLLLVSFVLLVIVLVIGNSVNGAARWIALGPINIQPAEIAKLSLFIFMSSYLSRKQEEVRGSFFGGFIKPIMVFSFLALLLLLQPDLGTVVVMLVTLFAMLFMAGAKLLQFISLLIAGIAIIGVLIATQEYRVRRVTSFLRPFEDQFGSGYNLTQSLMAFGRGDWFGQGLGNSIQKLKYLPEAHTDFVFAVIAEELGFVGVVLILILIFALVYKALTIGRNALQAGQFFAGFLAISISVWFAFQTLVNVGSTAGIMPTKGLTLPLISYGGSSLLVMSVSVAILLRIDYEYRIYQWELAKVAESENKQKMEETAKSQLLENEDEDGDEKLNIVYDEREPQPE